MSKARDLANAGTALTTVSATELGYLDRVTSAVQTQVDGKEPTLPSQTGNTGKYLTTDGTDKSWGTVSQYALPTQTSNEGKFLTTNGTSESWGTVSQPTTWTERLAATGNGFNNVEYNGSNMYVAVGGSGQLYSSPDGITWTSRTSTFGTSSILDVAFGNGLWVAVGRDGKIATSSDGITWTARTSNMGTNSIIKVHYANSLWVAVGNGGGTVNTGGITYSSDGTTWTRKSQSVSSGSSEYVTVIWNGTNWIIGTASSSNTNYLWASTPSGTWTPAGMAPNTDGILALFYDGTKTIINMNNDNWYFTNSGTILSDVVAYSGGPTFISTKENKNSKLYAGSIYLHSTYKQSFVAGTNIRPSQSSVEIGALTFMSNGSASFLSNRMSTFGVFPAGQIVCSNGGAIVTSF